MREALPAQLLRARWGGAGAALVPRWCHTGTPWARSGGTALPLGQAPVLCPLCVPSSAGVGGSPFNDFSVPMVSLSPHLCWSQSPRVAPDPLPLPQAGCSKTTIAPHCSRRCPG